MEGASNALTPICTSGTRPLLNHAPPPRFAGLQQEITPVRLRLEVGAYAMLCYAMIGCAILCY
eukprot:2913723-Pyramimonas_sp.AAC.1